MREFAADEGTSVHPQTVIEHFGSWNAAKRAAGLVPRRFATREELLGLLRELGDRVGRMPTAQDIDANRSWMPSKSLYWHTFGSLSTALKEAGFDVPRPTKNGSSVRSYRGSSSPTGWGGCRSSRTGRPRGRSDPRLLTEWQVYRMFDARRGAWSTFQFLLRDRLLARRARGRPGRQRSR